MVLFTKTCAHRVNLLALALWQEERDGDTPHVQSKDEELREEEGEVPVRLLRFRCFGNPLGCLLGL